MSPVAVVRMDNRAAGSGHPMEAHGIFVVLMSPSLSEARLPLQ